MDFSLLAFDSSALLNKKYTATVDTPKSDEDCRESERLRGKIPPTQQFLPSQGVTTIHQGHPSNYVLEKRTSSSMYNTQSKAITKSTPSKPSPVTIQQCPSFSAEPTSTT